MLELYLELQCLWSQCCILLILYHPFAHSALLETCISSSDVFWIVFKGAAPFQLPLPGSVVYGLSSMFVSLYIWVFKCFKSLEWKGLDFHALWITLYDWHVIKIVQWSAKFGVTFKYQLHCFLYLLLGNG